MHFHYDLFTDPSIIDQIEQARIYTIGVTNAPSTFFYSKRAEQGRKYFRAALGLHPELVRERSSELPLFRELLPQTRYIGEVGLDKRRSPDFSQQCRAFSQIIDWCAQSGDKIITVHSRGAEQEVLETIGGNYPGKIILHWYSGALSVLEKAIDYGCFLSVNWSMTQSNNGRQILAAIPKERILTESDGPFQQIKGQPASPLFIDQTLQALQTVKAEWGHKQVLLNQLATNLSELLTVNG